MKVNLVNGKARKRTVYCGICVVFAACCLVAIHALTILPALGDAKEKEESNWVFLDFKWNDYSTQIDAKARQSLYYGLGKVLYVSKIWVDDAAEDSTTDEWRLTFEEKIEVKKKNQDASLDKIFPAGCEEQGWIALLFAIPIALLYCAAAVSAVYFPTEVFYVSLPFCSLILVLFWVVVCASQCIPDADDGELGDDGHENKRENQLVPGIGCACAICEVLCLLPYAIAFFILYSLASEDELVTSEEEDDEKNERSEETRRKREKNRAEQQDERIRPNHPQTQGTE